MTEPAAVARALRGTMVPVGEIEAYRVDPPEGTALRGAVVLIHEIWGLVDHIKDVADRLAAAGYAVAAPDILSHAGMTPRLGDELLALMSSDDEAARSAAQPRMREVSAPARSPEYGAWAVARLVEVVDLLAALPGVDGRIGVTGFCFGGTYSFALAGADERIRASVPFYGAPPDLTKVGSIHCPVLALYGETDSRLVDGLPEVTEAMQAAGVDFASHVYPGVGHAFFNDRNPHAYDEATARDAWQRLLDFLAAHLG